MESWRGGGWERGYCTVFHFRFHLTTEEVSRGEHPSAPTVTIQLLAPTTLFCRKGHGTVQPCKLSSNQPIGNLYFHFQLTPFGTASDSWYIDITKPHTYIYIYVTLFPVLPCLQCLISCKWNWMQERSSLAPRPPPFFFFLVLQFAFGIIHGNIERKLENKKRGGPGNEGS